MAAWLEILGTVASLLAIIGVVLNNRRRIECFWVWMVSNSLTLLVHVVVGVWSLAARDLVFLGLAVEGLLKWRNSNGH